MDNGCENLRNLWVSLIKFLIATLKFDKTELFYFSSQLFIVSRKCNILNLLSVSVIHSSIFGINTSNSSTKVIHSLVSIVNTSICKTITSEANNGSLQVLHFDWTSLTGIV